MALTVIRHVFSAQSKRGLFHLNCHVQPGVRKHREGILSVSDSVIEVRVAAQPRDGEANKAVRELFSKVLQCPKSDVEVVSGLRSRDKTVAIGGIDPERNLTSCMAQIRARLESAVR
ncbi:unnamed protein product [Diplocarpon coronariae]